MQVDCGRPASPGANTRAPFPVYCQGACDAVGESHQSLMPAVREAVTKTVEKRSAPAECPAGIDHQASWLLPPRRTQHGLAAQTPQQPVLGTRHSHGCSDGGARGDAVVPKQLCRRECYASRDGRVKRPALHSVDCDFKGRHAVLRIRHPIPADCYAGLKLRG